MVEGIRKVVIGLIMLVSLLFGGMYVLIAIGQLLGIVEVDGMFINLIFGLIILFIGCMVIPKIIYRFTEDMEDGGNKPKSMKKKRSEPFGKVYKKMNENGEMEREEMEEETLSEEEIFTNIGRERGGF